MGRPRTYGERVATAIRLPVELHDALRRAADARQVAINYLITEAVRDWLLAQPVTAPPPPKRTWWQDIISGRQGPA